MIPVARLRITVVASFTVLALLSVAAIGNAGASTGSIANRHFSPRMLVRVASSKLVYVVGENSCGRSSCLALQRTDNNGASFDTVTPPPTTDIKDSLVGSLDEIVFANARDGYALEGQNGGEGVNNGDVLYATFNGARTWTKVPEPKGNALSRIAVSSDTLYGVTMHCAKQANGNVGCTKYQLVHTSLSVKHWVSAAVPNGRSFPWGFLGNVAAFGSNVWLTEGAKWSLVVASHDHGESFTKIPALGSVAGCNLTAASASVLWAACPTGMEVSFAYSDTAGSKWTTVRTNQFMGTGGGYFDPVSANLAYLDYGGSRPLYRVTDSGRDVTKAGTLECSSVNSSLGSLVFTGERTGLVICDPGGLWSSARLERTANGGATWSRIDPK
jgi:hypothetical protein